MSGAIDIEYPALQGVALDCIVDRVLVFDDFYPDIQLLMLAEWALRTPHWMLSNSVYDDFGVRKHRIWGASHIEHWRRQGWPGLPPMLFAAVASAFQRLGFVFTAPSYIGLNGQSRGQNASVHVDCARDARDQLSLLIYLGEDTDGDLLLFDKDARSRQLGCVRFRPNRVVVFDGSIPHAACAPSDDKFRMSVIVRGSYQCRQVETLSRVPDVAGTPPYAATVRS